MKKIYRLLLYFILTSTFIFAQNNDKYLFFAKSFPNYALSPKFFYTYKPFSLLSKNDYLKSDILSNTNQTTTEIIHPDLNFSLEKWDKFVQAEKVLQEKQQQQEIDENVKRALDFNWEPVETQLKIYGQLSLGISYGESFFLNKDQNRQARASSSAVRQNLDLDQKIDIHISGKIGKKVKVNVDNSGKRLNTIRVDYDNSQNKKAFIQKITAGNISVSLSGSSLASGTSGGGKEAIGIKVEAQKNKFKLQGIASMSRGMQGVKNYKGSTSPTTKDIDDTSYVKFRYYFLPQDYKPGTLKIFLDDKKGTYYERIIDSTHSYKLSPGTDYVEEGDRLIYFKKSISQSYDVFVTYEPVSSSFSFDTNISTNTYSKDYKQIITNQIPNSTNTEPFIYLLRANQISPYEFRGAYYLGNRHIDISKDWIIYLTDHAGNKLDITLTKDDAGNVIQDDNNPYHYYLDTENGYLVFRDNEPFKQHYNNNSKDPYYILYTYSQRSAESLLKIHVEYKYQIKQYSLGWDVIKNSEIVIIDGAVQKRNVDYTIDYQTGIINFKKNINPESEITIYYQYSPFGFSSQQILLGLRGDYTPTKWFNLTGVGFYNGQQRPIRIPSARSTPDEKLVGSLSGKISFKGEQLTSYFSNIGIGLKKTIPIDISGNGEVAGSLYNPNNFGLAMVEDFEGSQISRSIWMDYRRFFSYIPVDSTSYSISNMGKIYYKDYYDYRYSKHYYQDFDFDFSADGSIANPADRTNVSYNIKAGPYMVGEGHIDDVHFDTFSYTRQSSMVIDYEFPDVSDGWVALIYNRAFDKVGANFENYKEIDLWVKLLSDSSTNKVEVVLGIGKFNEDIDNDGASLEEEANQYADGLTFNDPKNGITKVGGGSHIVIDGVENDNDGTRQTEDLDGNRQLDTITLNDEKNNIYFPDSKFTTVQGGLSTSSVKLKADGEWTLIKISIDKTKMDEEQQNLLRTGIKNLVVYVKQVDGGGEKGKLLIDDIEFKGSTYDDIHVDNTINPTLQSNEQLPIELNYLSTFDALGDTSYFNNSLRAYTESDEFTKNDLYKHEKSYDQLHGRKTENEWNQTEEHALELRYLNLKNYDFSQSLDLQPNSNSFVLAGRNLTSTYDFRFYKMLKVWVKVNATNRDAWLVYRFGSSSADYYEYRINLHELTEPWNLIKMDLRSDEFLNLTNRLYTDPNNYDQHFRINGNPSLRAIKYIGFGLYGGDPYSTSTNTSGSLWINDNYLDKIELQTGLAYHYSGNFTLRKHLNVAYSYSKRDKYFSSYGAAGTGVLSENKNISASWSSLSWLPVSANWNRSFTESDIDDITLPYNQKGKNNSDTKSISGSLNLGTWSIFGKAKPYIPGISGSYRVQSSSNSKPLSLEQKYYLSTLADSKSYNVSAKWKPPFLDKIKIKSSTSFAYSFSENSTKNYKYASTNSITNFVENPISFSKSMNYALSFGYKNITMNPSYNYKETKIGLNKFSFTDDNPKLQGYTNNETYSARINTRSRSLSLPINLGKIWILKPAFTYNVNYNESGFQYFETPITLTSNYTIISRNPSTTISFSENLGSFSFKHFFITSITPRYSRSFSFSDQQQRVLLNDSDRGRAYFWQFFRDFGYKVFIPNPLQFIPIQIASSNSETIPRFNNMDFVSTYTDHPNTAISLNETAGASIGFNIFQIIKGTVSYSFSQNTSRSKNNYSTFKQTHSFSYGSGINLMDKLKGFLIWKPSKTYTKSSSLSYSFSYSLSKDYLSSMRTHSFRPRASVNYSWKKETSMSLSANYTYNKGNLFKPDIYFKRYTAYYLPTLYNSLAWDREVYPHSDTSLNLTLSYKFPSNLPDTWKPPLFKKAIKLDNHINHTATLSFANHIYNYDKKDKYLEPDDILATIVWGHSVRYDITKNIDGDIWGKIAYDLKKIKDRTIGADGSGDKKEDVGSYEIGMTMRIKF